MNKFPAHKAITDLFNRRPETAAPSDLVMDVLNFSKSMLSLKDFHPARPLGGREGYPHEILIPPGCMASVPDSHYKGKTADGKNIPTGLVIHIWGPKRPLRQARGDVILFDPDVYEMPEAWQAGHFTLLSHPKTS